MNLCSKFYWMKYIITSIFVAFSIFYASGQDVMVLKPNGKVVIGDTSAINLAGNYNLYVQHGVLTERVKVAVNGTADWSDHAFSHTPELDQVKSYIEQKSHLYNMPSAETLVKDGYDVRAMDAKLLEQIEWLWQYTIQLAEENDQLKKELESLKKANKPE